MPMGQDWVSLLLIFVAIGFLTVSERRRAAELRARREIAGPDPAAAERR
jgi:hypothetical protein